MVVIDKFRVNIVCGDNKSKEYHVPPDEEERDDRDLAIDTARRATRYIQAIPDIEYQIRIGVRTGFDFGNEANCLKFRVYVDGLLVCAGHVSKKYYKRHAGYNVKLKGRNVPTDQGWYIFPLTWSTLVTGEDVFDLSAEELHNHYGQVGTIRVEIWRMRGHKQHGREPGTPEQGFLVATDYAPETAFKGQTVDMRTCVGVPRRLPRMPRSWVGICVDEHPIAEFTFKYRSRRGLQAIALIPRDPTPVPLEERNVEEMTREELMELARRFQATRETMNANIKIEAAAPVPKGGNTT